jgi:cytochrome c-type biogenesis protein
VFIGALLFLNINPFRNLPQVKVPVLSNPYLNAFLYGLLYGPIALPCSGTLVVSIFALSLSGGETIGRLSTFLWFGIGLGTPLLLLSFLSGAARRWITRFFARRARIINTIGGILLVALGVYDFVANWGFIKIVLS